MIDPKISLDLAKEFARGNLRGLILEVQVLKNGENRGQLLDRMSELLADFGHVRFALGMDIIRDAAFEYVLDH